MIFSQAGTSMNDTEHLFELERHGETVIVVPTVDLREFEFQQIEEQAQEVLSLLSNGDAKNVIVDFSRTDYYGSTALGFFVKLWKRVRAKDGRMAFCNVSQNEQEILDVTHLDRLWSICSNREEALKVVEG
jgi:anti-sigma B factor antagonist